MKSFRKSVWIVCLLLAGGSFAAEISAGRFGDLAVLLAKGWFGGYVSPNASVAECVAFLNRQGVTFSLLDVMDPDAVVTLEDVARAAGQSVLLFKGEAVLERGRIKKPLEADSWVDYCVLNDVEIITIWDGFQQRTAEGPLPEVKKFFRR